MLDEGSNVKEIQLGMMEQLAEAGVSRQEFSEVWNPYMGAMIVSAVFHYCPQHKDNLDNLQ